nr:MAG TPA: hypothetical protein [Caudoviricetes sp.]DAI34202.1 MAG TPA: hypothetical protein [Caudoviricetes sp.]
MLSVLHYLFIGDFTFKPIVHHTLFLLIRSTYLRDGAESNRSDAWLM